MPFRSATILLMVPYRARSKQRSIRYETKNCGLPGQLALLAFGLPIRIPSPMRSTLVAWSFLRVQINGPYSPLRQQGFSSLRHMRNSNLPIIESKQEKQWHTQYFRMNWFLDTNPGK
jgi:hypothetical protein